MRYLSYRPRSESEVRSYLRRLGCPPEAVDTALAKLRSLNYLNDESFARDWARSKAQNFGYGPRRIEQQLRTKGIAQPLAREALREVFAEAEEEALARRLLATRFSGQDIKEPKVRHRAVAMLQRRGFSAKIIFDLLKYSIDED